MTTKMPPRPPSLRAKLQKVEDELQRLRLHAEAEEVAWRGDGVACVKAALDARSEAALIEAGYAQKLAELQRLVSEINDSVWGMP